MKPGHVSLERALSKLGWASRTQARRWILEGQVKVGGRVQRDALFPVKLEHAQIEVAGKVVGRVAPRTFLLHKPRSVVTTRSDEKGRTTVFQFVQVDVPHLCAVGRLDFATSGLLLLTNDTALAHWLTDPRNGMVRSYVVSVRGLVTDEKLNQLRAGVHSDGEFLKPEQVLLRKSSGKESHLTVELTEGKNREIRRLFKSVGHEVTRLKRISFGALELGELESGKYREMTLAELKAVFPKAPIRTDYGSIKESS